MEAAFQCLNHLINEDGKMFVIAGSAGTGKTYLLNAMESLLKTDYQVRVGAFTGVASKLASNHGSTLHTLLYEPYLDENENIKFQKKDINDIDFDYLIVDEASMVPDEMLDFMLDTNAKIIFFGDHKQLPPVSTSHVNLLDNPDYTLTEIVRTKKDDPIVKLSIDYYNGHKVTKKYNKYDNINVTTESLGNLLRNNEYDVIIAPTNDKRKTINKMVRHIKGIDSELPVSGEPIVCLKNEMTPQGEMVFNGEVFTVTSVSNIPNSDYQYYDFVSQDGTAHRRVKINNRYFENDFNRYDMDIEGYAFTFAYALTCHKTQGKQFDRVLYIDDDVSYFLPQNRYGYTAITRTVKELTIKIK